MLSRRHKRAIIGFLFIGLFLVLIFFVTARYFAGLAEQRQYLAERSNLEERPPNIYVLERSDGEQRRKFSASIEPWQSATLAAEVAGTVEQIKVEIGDLVEQGDELIHLDCEVEVAALAAAEAQVAENRRLLAEVERLAKRNVAATTELEAAKARLAVSEAQLAQARENLELHTIKAPFSGAVNARHVDVGDLAAQGISLLEIVDTSKLRVVFHVSEYEVDAFAVGSEVALRPNRRSGQPLNPQVQFVAAAADPATRMFRVEAVLDETDGLRGGMQGTITAVVDTFRDTLLVPAAAVRLSGEKALVAKVVDGGSGYEQVEIEVGQEVNGMYPVLHGLEEGESILIQ